MFLQLLPDLQWKDGGEERVCRQKALSAFSNCEQETVRSAFAEMIHNVLQVSREQATVRSESAEKH